MMILEFPLEFLPSVYDLTLPELDNIVCEKEKKMTHGQILFYFAFSCIVY